MKRGFGWQAARSSQVSVSEEKGVRMLHLGSRTVQSAMRLSAPEDLELAYARAMMGFLLFKPDPEDILMVGLGGGSIPKFVHRRMPRVRTTVVEIEPQVVAAARHYFHFPLDDERLRVEMGEGGDWVARHPGSADVLLVDGFEDDAQVPSLCSQAFYDAACALLRRDGVMAVNFLASDGSLDACLQRIETSFEGRVALLEAESRGNVIVFALRYSPGRIAWSELRARAQRLEDEYGLAFGEFVAGLKKLNPHTARHLNI